MPGRGVGGDPPGDPEATLADLTDYCDEAVGAPRVEEVVDGVWVAIGYDLANTILIETAEGNVIVDVSMSPERAETVREALEAVAPGPVAAIVYTHSHIDHVGGATAWADEDTPIWATDAFLANLLKQYGQFAQAESRRGDRQFGDGVSADHLPCSALGARVDLEAARMTGTVIPNNTFTGFQRLEIGGVTIELHEAHGETTDQLFVWLPESGALLPGDNYYATFPNLYTIRGTSPRPVDDWIRSLDRMRAFDPAALVPSHTVPVVGQSQVRAALRTYRDGIQWVRDAVVRGANDGDHVDAIAASVTLPPHLADAPQLVERYGQIDWSARAIYGGELGWFDGRTAQLYPPANTAARELAMMGGADAALAEARRALDAGDPRWAVHLIGKVLDAGVTLDDAGVALRAAAYDTLSGEVGNTNGRGWLRRVADELRGAAPDNGAIVVNDRLLEEVPVDIVFELLPSRLDVAATTEVEEMARIELSDRAFNLVIRRGVAEITEGDPLPDSPPLAVTIRTDDLTWKSVALGRVNALDAVIAGDLEGRPSRGRDAGAGLLPTRTLNAVRRRRALGRGYFRSTSPAARSGDA